MIGIICAMSEERDALLKLMTDVKVKKGHKLFYHQKELDNEYYIGKIGDKDVVLSRCGVGKIYAAMLATKFIEKFKPELIINLGCAGSLDKDVHIGDVVVVNKIADWEVDVPGWERSYNSPNFSFECDKKVLDIVKKIKTKTKIHFGPAVSGDEFIYKKSQVKIIKRYYPESLCGEMEGCAIATVCYAHSVNCAIIRSISDETLVNGSFKEFDFNLPIVCKTAAELAAKIIKKY